MTDVPYVWQEINGFCAWAATAMALQYAGADVGMHDVFALSSIGFSYAYIHYNDTILMYPGAFYDQVGPTDLVSYLYGINYTIYLHEDTPGVEQAIQSWASQGINAKTLSGQSDAFNLMRTAIDIGYPLLISVDPSYLPADDYDYLRETDTSGGGHGVLIVGYNDTNGIATIMDPGVGSFGNNFGFPEDGRGNYSQITYTALNDAWSSRLYISNLFTKRTEEIQDKSAILGPLLRDKLLGVGSTYAPTSSSAYLWDYGESAFRRMSEDFTTDGLKSYLSIFDGMEDELSFKTSILLFLGLGLESALTLQYLSYRSALDALPYLMPDIDLTDFLAEAELALGAMSQLSDNSTLIYPGNLSAIEGRISTGFFDISQAYNNTGDIDIVLQQNNEFLSDVSSSLMEIADSWLAAGNELATIWPNDVFIQYGPIITIAAFGAGALIVGLIIYIRKTPSQ